ncbi:MAG TPA: ATP-binding protein, partial [Blastocatellia bacterium]|nr:ATP-binding protein [Blastocatellia bacterium]
MTMKPSQLRQFLASAIKQQLPILITGAPGVGKSDIVASAAQDAQAELIISHPVVSDPTDAKGLPWANKNATEATFLPFGELARALKATKPTVWFLDDLGQASPAVQASFMQLILARRVNGHALPDCITFVAATNRRTDRAGVSGILEPVKSRFASIVPLEADLDDWCAWAIDKQLPVELIAFMRFR